MLKTTKDIAESLLANKADVNAKDNDGWTPLHEASYEGSKEVAEVLLANKADVKAKDKLGNTPLQAAENADHKEIAELLRKNGGQSSDPSTNSTVNPPDKRDTKNDPGEMQSSGSNSSSSFTTTADALDNLGKLAIASQEVQNAKTPEVRQRELEVIQAATRSLQELSKLTASKNDSNGQPDASAIAQAAGQSLEALQRLEMAKTPEQRQAELKLVTEAAKTLNSAGTAISESQQAAHSTQNSSNTSPANSFL
jgi:ankyrin repeat protein